jgi:MFS transporter, DHA1 family, inner membrane transport protein
LRDLFRVSLAGEAKASVPFGVAGMVLLLLLWGLIGWQLPAAQQLNLVQLAPQAGPVVLSLQGSTLYLGVSAGALVGSLTLQFGHPALLGWIGAACELLGLLIWFIHRPGRLPVAAEAR